jgi:hypothetical protein
MPPYFECVSMGLCKEANINLSVCLAPEIFDSIILQLLKRCIPILKVVAHRAQVALNCCFPRHEGAFSLFQGERLGIVLLIIK